MKASDIRIEDPCAEDLDRMPRSLNARFCDRCRRKVHDLSSMTRREAEAFIAGAEEACVSFAYDDDGDIVFRHPVTAALLAGRDEARRMLTVAATVPILATAACHRTETTDREAKAHLVAVASAASTAPCESDLMGEITKLKTALTSAKDEAGRARIETDLVTAQDELRKHQVGPDRKHHMVAGKMVREPDRKGHARGCNCPPGDPLCSCI
jgi:hypothetical protein